MFSTLRKSVLLLLSVGACGTSYGQAPASPVMLLACGACALSAQTLDSRSMGLPMVEFLDNPKPFSFDDALSPEQLKKLNKAGGGPKVPEMSWHITARLVSTRPLVLDVLDVPVTPGSPKENVHMCGLQTIALVDSKLKGAFSRLRFNQIVKAKLIYGGNREFPHEVVLTELSPAAQPGGNAANCPNQSGLLLSYRGLVEYVNVYNDGGIYYKDPLFNEYGTQKLSREELEALMKLFSESRFDSVPSGPRPMGDVPDRYSLTLICARDQYVALPGLEAKLASLLARLETLKDRATSQTSYVLMYTTKIKQSIAEWPYPQFPLSKLGPGRPRGVKDPEAEKLTLPEELLSRLAVPTYNARPPVINAQVYWTSEGKLYRVFRTPRWGGQDSCNTLECVSAEEVLQPKTVLTKRVDDPKNPSSGTVLAGSVGFYWPGDVDPRLAQVGKEGLRIAQEEYDKHRQFYFELVKVGSFGGGLEMVENGYLYRGLRICRVDPQQPKTLCTETYEHWK